MMKKYLLCLLLTIGLLISGTVFAKPGDADYSGLLKVSEVESVSGKSKLSLRSMDSKKSGEAYDLQYSTADGHAVLMIQVLHVCCCLMVLMQIVLLLNAITYLGWVRVSFRHKY